MEPHRRSTLLLILSLFVCGAALASPPQNVIWYKTAGRAIAISPDAQLLLAGIQLRHTSDGSLVRTFQFGYTSGSVVNAAAFSPDGKLAALGVQAFNQNLALVRVSDGTSLAGRISAHNNGTTSVAFSPDGQFLVTAEGTVRPSSGTCRT